MSFSYDAWELLGLDRSAADEREVKRAYARLLKLHRPDQDPEGFQRVSEAYQRALRDLSADRDLRSLPAGTADPLTDSAGEREAARNAPGEGTGFEEPAGPGGGPGAWTPEDHGSDPAAEGKTAGSGEGRPGEPAEAPAPRRLEDFPDLPEKFRSTVENLLHRMRRAAPSPEAPEFNMLRNMVRENPALAAPWVVVLESLFQTERGLRLLPQIKPADVLLLMRHGEGGCAARILMTWRDDISLLNRLTQLANLMLEQKVGNDPGMLRALHFTAQMAAFHLPYVAGHLADELYRQTGPGVREQIVREIELRSAAGKAFATFPLPQRRVWEQQLFETGEGEADWHRPEAIAALKSVIAGCGQDWEGWPLVTRVVPADLLHRTLSQVRQAQATARPAPKRSWLPSGRWAFLVLWAVVHLLTAVFKGGNSIPRSNHAADLPPLSDYDSWKSSQKNPRVPPAGRRSQVEDMQAVLDKTLGTSTSGSGSGAGKDAKGGKGQNGGGGNSGDGTSLDSSLPAELLPAFSHEAGSIRSVRPSGTLPSTDLWKQPIDK